ncbi:Uncharacterised protein [Mycobacterium tuberculosis]|nr:Uncharacterised protein [Mycobacterium tuberculosis]
MALSTASTGTPCRARVTPSSATNASSPSVGPRRAAIARVAAASSARVCPAMSAGGRTEISRTSEVTPATTDGSRSSSPEIRSMRSINGVHAASLCSMTRLWWATTFAAKRVPPSMFAGDVGP